METTITAHRRSSQRPASTVLVLAPAVALFSILHLILAASAQPPHAQGDVEVLVRTDFVHLVDQPPKAAHGLDLSAGDLRLSDDFVFDHTGATHVGQAVTRIQGMHTPHEGNNDALFVIDCTIRLDGGSLMFYGAGDFSKVMTDGADFSIIGGTGRYVGARGTVTMQATEAGTRLHFQFSRP